MLPVFCHGFPPAPQQLEHGAESSGMTSAPPRLPRWKPGLNCPETAEQEFAQQRCSPGFGPSPGRAPGYSLARSPSVYFGCKPTRCWLKQILLSFQTTSLLLHLSPRWCFSWGETKGAAFEPGCRARTRCCRCRPAQDRAWRDPRGMWGL